VIKNDGTRQLFNRAKLLAGLYRACEKTPVTSLELEKLVDTVEHEIYASGDQEVRSARIGDLVMDQLARLNEVAYVRFASVYRRFKDIVGFEKELSIVRQGKHIVTHETVKD
jgi:transcriptional repressor NrdR